MGTPRPVGIAWVALASLSIAITVSPATRAQIIPTSSNQTPGDGDGADDHVIVFAPYFWEEPSAELEVRSYCLEQGYRWDEDYIVTQDPGDNPGLCQVDSFYHVIHDCQSKLGVLYVTSHGALVPGLTYTYILAVESFATVAARDAKLESYYSRPQRPYSQDEVVPLELYRGPSIAVTSLFLRNYGRLTRSLVYLGACNSGHPESDALRRLRSGNALVALGNEDNPEAAESGNRAALFFRCLDGKGQVGDKMNRTVREALDVVNGQASGGCLRATGIKATTLSPAVTAACLPCPIHVGDSVSFFLDTYCDDTNPPEIEGTGCEIAYEVWGDGATATGICIMPPPPGATDYVVRLTASSTKSRYNASHLDGNLEPPDSNAVGPSDDDYERRMNCSD